MMRAARRQLRAWGREFAELWGRLRSFHRVSLGIILAFAITSLVQRYGFTVLKSEIAKARETATEKKVPDIVTLPENDPETMELQLRLENSQQTIGSRRAEKERAVAAWPRFTRADQGTMLARFNALITDAGLRCLAFHDAAAEPRDKKPDPRAAARVRRPAAKPDQVPPAKEPKEPLPSVVHHCVLAGSFASISRFLHAVDSFEYPARVENVQLQLPSSTEDESTPIPPVRPNVTPVIQLSFDLKLFLSE